MTRVVRALAVVLVAVTVATVGVWAWWRSTPGHVAVPVAWPHRLATCDVIVTPKGRAYPMSRRYSVTPAWVWSAQRNGAWLSLEFHDPAVVDSLRAGGTFRVRIAGDPDGPDAVRVLAVLGEVPNGQASAPPAGAQHLRHPQAR